MQADQNQLITVRKICDIAQIHPGTFYIHYASIYDLLDNLDSILRMNTVERFEKAGVPLCDFISEEGMGVILQCMD